MTSHSRGTDLPKANRPSDDPRVPSPLPSLHHHEEPPPAQARGHGHGLMMLACCVPMLVIAGALVATGVAGASAILFALICTAMMAAMIFGMGGNHRM